MRVKLKYASLSWANINYGINGENDTFDFKFVLIDLKGNRSDTAATGKLVVTRIIQDTLVGSGKFRLFSLQ